MHRMSRPRRVGRSAAAFLALSCLVALGGPSGCERKAPRPDILLVTIDTLRADHCSAYGYPVRTTPEMEALAAEGLLFQTAYAESATTGPSHAVLLTGRHFRTSGVFKNGEPMPEESVTIPETLAANGYATAGFVSSFPLRARFGFAQGFEIFDDEFTPSEASLGRRKEGEQAHDRLAEATVSHVEKWLDQRQDQRPLFLWVHLVDPHYPYRSPEKFQGSWPVDTDPLARRYDAEVRYSDKQFGRLRDLFRTKTPGHEDLVLLTSDHGEGLGDHGWMSHGINLYEEAVRVPLVASWPGRLPEGEVVTEPVAILDVKAGILDLLDIEPTVPLHGPSLFGSLDADRAVFLQRRNYKTNEVRGVVVGGEMTAVVHRGEKFISAPDEHRRELYDLPSDPHELADLLLPPDQAAAARPGRGRTVAEKAIAAKTPPAADAETRPAAPRPPRERSEATAHSLDGDLARWREANPLPERGETPIDKEALKALRSLGYVE